MNLFEQFEELAVKKVLTNIIEHIDGWLMICDINQKIIYVNKQVEKISGFTKKEILGRCQDELWVEGAPNVILKERIQETVESGRGLEIVTKNRAKDGSIFYLSAQVTGVKEEDQFMYYIWMAKDITDTKVMHEAIYKIQYYDDLTELPNQKAFLEEIESLIQVSKNKKFTVILFDVSKMSYINNTYGLNAGDAVLKEVGRRIKAVLTNQYYLAKLNTDLFGVIIEDTCSSHLIENTINQIIENMKSAVKLETGEVYIDLKAGIVCYPDHGESVGEIINRAQIALAKVKQNTKQLDYMFYKSYMQEEVQKRMLLESDMHKAYENDEFIVYYQPFMELGTQKLTGIEALLRRRKGTGELILPGKFIALLEEMDLIEQVGLRVIENVCKQLRKWIDEAYQVVPVSINLSSVQFKNKKLAKQIVEILEQYNIDPKLLVLEVTETVLMEDVYVAQNILNELKNKGFTIAIDDFGTGYSSLSYLKKFIFDHLKIDISFIKEIAQKEEDRAIVAAIISISKALKLTTIAEGIETPEQLELVREMGCEMGQGFFWDKPMEAQGIQEKYLEKYGMSMVH